MTAPGPLLLFGAAGQLGQEILALYRESGEEIVGLARAQCDIADKKAVEAAMAEARPRLVVNVAAYTAVDKAESEPEAAFAGNALGPQNLAEAAAARQVALVHISTDYVFEGAKRGAYVESDPIAPVGVYGQTKAEGERRVHETAPRHLILRTSWVYGRYGANFLKTMLRLAAEREELRVVADQRGCPTSTRDLAEAVRAVDRRLSPDFSSWGVYHFAGQGATSWHEFACEIVEAQAPYTGRRPKVTAIATRDYPTAAKRPANSELDSSRFTEAFGYRAAPWRERTREVVGQIFEASR